MYILSHEHNNAYYSSIPKVYDFDLSHIPLYLDIIKLPQKKTVLCRLGMKTFMVL
jgi:hypothetical protein